MLKTVDKSQYQQIQALIEQNDSITGFDLYYLGFFSHFVSQITLHDIFTHIGNIISLYNDNLITSQEKIEFLIRMLSKKIDSKLIDSLNPQTGDTPDKSNNFLHSYFSQILKLIPKFPNVSKFELFYIGRFHAICPSYKISELFQHINNINTLVTEDLIDEETKVDFLLTILNKKIQTSFSGETVLNIPQGDLSPISARPSSPKPQFSSQDRPSIPQASLVQQIATRKEASSQSSDEGERGRGVQWDRQDTAPVKSGNQSDIDEENNNRRNSKNQTTIRRQFTFQSSHKKGDEVEEEDEEEGEEEEDEERESQEEEAERKDYESEEDAFSLLKKQNETKKKASVEKEAVHSMEEEEDEDEEDEEDEEKATEGISVGAVEEESGKKRAMSEHLSETNKRREPYSRGGTIEEESEGREMTFGENSQSQMIGSQKVFGGTLEDDQNQGKAFGATPPDTIENQNEGFEEEHEEVEKGTRRADSGVSAGSKKSQADNDLEVQKLMAQLYPGSEKEKKKQPGGTLDDILNSLLGGSDEGKASQTTSQNNSLMPSLDTRSFSVPKDKIHAGQEIAQSLEQHGGNSLEEQPEHEEEDEDEGFVAPKSHKKDDMEVEKEGVNQTIESEEVVHDDRGTLADPSEIGSSLPISPSLGPDASYILNMKSRGLEDPYKELLLKQIATNAQPGVYLDNIVKQEEEPRNSIREAQTQADPTLEDHEGDHHVMVIRSPGHLDAHIRTCETEKQTLSQPPKESLQIEEDHGQEENDAVEEIASNKPSQQDDRQSQWSQSRRETFNEMYPVGATQMSKMSSFPVNLSTLEEVKLSKELLDELQREREAAEKKKVAVVVESSSKKASQEQKKPSQEVQPVEEEKKKDDNQDAMEEEVTPEAVEKPIDVEEEKRKAAEEAEEKKLLAEREQRLQKEKEQELQRAAEKELLEDLSRCPLCGKALMLEKIVAIEGCGHEIHEECLKRDIEKKVADQEVVITCPRKRCDTNLRLVDFMDYLDVEKQEKYVTVVLNSYIESMEDVSCCPTLGCHYAFLKSYKPNKFTCSQCEKSYCMNCRVEWHQGLNCEDYQRQNKVEDDVWHKDGSGYAIGKYKQCGTCKHWACKKFGSKLVECQCKQKFCYVCGRKKLRGECNCPQQKEEDLRPIVQPELFHKIMNSPAEYRRYTAENSTKGSKSPAGKGQGQGNFRANVDDEIELHITGKKK